MYLCMTFTGWGMWSVGTLQSRAIANIPLVGAFLGVAEAAQDIALAHLGTQSRLGRPASESSGVQHMVAEMALELAQSRAILGAAAIQMDEYFASHAPGESAPTMQDAHRLMLDYQVAKWTVNRGAIAIVSKAMDLLGGSGYTNSHVLARLYRDVRAGPFMQPFGSTELREYVGMVITEVGDDYIKATMPVNAHTRQHMGVIHGGASVVLAAVLIVLALAGAVAVVRRILGA